MAALSGRTTIRFTNDQTNDFVSVSSLTSAANHAVSTVLGLIPMRPELDGGR